MDYIDYDIWVKEGQRLFGDDKKEIMYWFLYGIKNFISMRDAELRKLLFKRLEVFTQKNIKLTTNSFAFSGVIQIFNLVST